ncbi:MAG: sensor histidine kinase [bacterium]|nr:sensor histidine kinase [bacterium]MDI1336753.1 sensor histidine kinase [Lacunisphaera sp.]
MPLEEFKTTLDSWVLRVLTQPPAGLGSRLGIIASLVLGIGAIDYLSGIWISLQVFYLVPIAFAVAWLGFLAAFLTSIICIIVRVGGDYLQGAPYTVQPSIAWNSLVFLMTYMVVAWGIYLLVNFQRELEERVRARTSALARETNAREQLQQELIELSERERRTIGNDLHDGLGQHLTAMAYAAQILSQQLATQQHPAASAAQQIVQLAEDGILQSRQLARGLLLTAIEPGSLNRELEELAASVQRQSGVRCYYESGHPPLVNDSTTASHIFRIAQEAVRNSIRHAHPTALNLSLTSDSQALVLSVRDNGPGLPATPGSKAGVGLRVMAHRAKLIGADFTLESTPGEGTHIRCRVPLPKLPAPALAV